MQLVLPLPRAALLLAAIGMVAMMTGCTRRLPESTVSSKATQGPASAPQGIDAATKLGDLSAFHQIATEVAGIVQRGDLGAAKSRIKDLEVAWDAAEAGLKPRAAQDWHVLDKAIDDALAALRADPPNQANCQQAMKSLLETFNHLEGKA